MKYHIALPFGLLLAAACSSSKTPEPKNIIKAPVLAEEELLSNAITAYDRELYSVSLDSWTELRDGYPASYFSPLAEIKIADSQYYSGDFASAQLSYEEFTKLHPGHEAIPYTRYQIGMANLEQYRGAKHDQAPLHTAIRTFMQVISDFPQSEYAVLARRQLDRCRELLAEHEAYVAGFYSRRGNKEASSKRLIKLRFDFPEAKITSETTQQLAKEDLVDTGVSAQNPGQRPNTPQMLPSHKLSKIDYPTKIAGLRSVAPPAANAVDTTAGSQPTVEQTSAPLSLELACEQNDDGALFTLYFRESIKVEAVKTLADNNAQLSVAFSGTQTQQISPQECTAGGLMLHAQQNSGSNILIDLRASYGFSFSTLLLDRPHRLVIVAGRKVTE